LNLPRSLRHQAGQQREGQMRRLAKGRPSYRALWHWRNVLRGWFPHPPETPVGFPRSFHDEKAPIDLYPVGRPETLRAWRLAIARTCVAIAADALAARPPELSHVRVAAGIVWPTAELSRVTYFFDPDYFATFEHRDTDGQRWTPLGPERSLLGELGYAATFLRERGYRERIVDDPSDPASPVFESEIWLIGD
jgi:hypothetical protein